MKKKKLRIICFSLIFILLVVLGSPFLLAFTPHRINKYAYQQVLFSHIADIVSGEETEDEKIFLKLFDYITFNITVNTGPATKSIDLRSYLDLIRGVSWCDQQAWDLMALLNKRGVKSRYLDVKSHTAMEVFIDGAWRLADPFFSALYYNSKGELATQENVLSDYGNGIFSESVESYKAYNISGPHLNPKRLYMARPVRFAGGKSPPFKILGYQNLPPRNIVDSIVSWGLKFYGTPYAYWYQDRFLQRNINLGDQGEKWIWGYLEKYKNNERAFFEFFKARNYHLFHRYEEALVSYNKLIEKYSGTVWAEESRFFKGMLYFETQKYQEAMNIFLKIINISFPPKNYQFYHYPKDLDYQIRYPQSEEMVALIHEKLGNTDSAVKYYRKSLRTSLKITFPLAINLYRVENSMG